MHSKQEYMVFLQPPSLLAMLGHQTACEQIQVVKLTERILHTKVER